MIIDVHYHWWKLPSDENVGRQITAGLIEDAERNGVKRQVDEIYPTLRDYMDDLDCDKLVKRMDTNGIDVTVILMMDNYDMGASNERILQANERCAKAAARHPGRLLSMASIDPRRPEAPALLRKCLGEYKMNGLKWHPDNGFYPNSKESYAVLEVANEFGVPLLTHCGLLARARAKYTHPLHLDDVALDFPNLQIIAAHMGHMWWQEWAAIAQYKANLSGDMAMWQLMAVAKPALFRKTLRNILDIMGHEQVLFSSDGPVYEPLVDNKKWIDIIKGLIIKGKDDIVFSQTEIDAILGGNAQRIFKLNKRNSE